MMNEDIRDKVKVIPVDSDGQDAKKNKVGMIWTCKEEEYGCPCRRYENGLQ